MIPDYRKLKNILTRASQLHLLTEREVEEALRDRDSIVLEQQKAARYGRRLLSENAASNDYNLVDILKIMKPRAANAYVLMCELDRIVGELKRRVQPTEKHINCVLETLDAKICLAWCNIEVGMPLQSNESPQRVLQRLGRYESCRLLSARAAELIVAAYFRDLGKDVQDISIQQLNGCTDDWKYFDLKVADRYIDVKNSRKSIGGGQHYVEHCVPQFKRSRTDRKDVAIFGVVSPYLADPSKYFDGTLEAIVLGEVNVQDVRELFRWARSRFGKSLDLAGIWGSGYLPGWIFEYPSDHYPGRSAAIAALPTLVFQMLEAGAPLDGLPEWLHFFQEDARSMHQEPILESRIRKDLKSIHSTIGFSRRSIYVYAMGLAIQALERHESPEVDLAILQRYLGLGGVSGFLFLDDPLQYVTSLIDSLLAICNEILRQRLQVVAFRLTHPSILQGVLENGMSVRLLAYCGGRINNVQCGTTPLVFGRNLTCRQCKYLICPNCGNCSESCTECQPRINRLINEGRLGGGMWRGYQESPYPDNDLW